MVYCKHKCPECETEWECDFPYYSNHEYFEEVVQLGYYCNSYCPNCKPKERKELDELFQISNNHTNLEKKLSFYT
ncbi:MAG: hypothetical protein ACTSSG_00825 [Candidatus Heimdallarchaeaceae archaeon]